MRLSAEVSRLMVAAAAPASRRCFWYADRFRLNGRRRPAPEGRPQVGHPATRRIQGPQATHHVVVEVPRGEVVKRQRRGWTRTLPETLRQEPLGDRTVCRAGTLTMLSAVPQDSRLNVGGLRLSPLWEIHAKLVGAPRVRVIFHVQEPRRRSDGKGSSDD